jgi:ribonuclease BN (tRNA processing enzyme)
MAADSIISLRGPLKRDAGRGATIRLAQLDIPIGRIDTLLLTHFHSDHTVGVPDIWLTGWLGCGGDGGGDRGQVDNRDHSDRVRRC